MTDENSGEGQGFGGDMTPQAAFELLSDHPSLNEKSFWLDPARRPFLATIRQDQKLWEGLCVLARQSWLSQKELEAYLDAMTLRDTDELPDDQKPTKDDALATPQVNLLRTTGAWAIDILCTTKGGVKECASNIQLLLRHHSEWEGRWWWDEVNHRPMLDKEPITDTTIEKVALWLGTEIRMATRSDRLISRAIHATANDRPRDVITEWLDGLSWDGTHRLRYWLRDYAQMPDTPETAWVSWLMITSMVIRAYLPGVLYRYVVILEGGQGVGKSSLLRLLAGSWYVELSQGLEGKEAHLMLDGAWLGEFGELHSLSKTDITKLKSFITLEKDSYIPKYSNFRKEVPRRTVFVGTTEQHTEYLDDQEGNTRFIPIAVGEIDLDGIAKIRDQLFAEAVKEFRDMPPHEAREVLHTIPSSCREWLDAQRDERRKHSIYEELLREWWNSGNPEIDNARIRHKRMRDDVPVTFFSIQEIMALALQIDAPERWKDKSLQMQVAQALRATGWERKLRRINGGPMWGWDHVTT